VIIASILIITLGIFGWYYFSTGSPLKLGKLTDQHNSLQYPPTISSPLPTYLLSNATSTAITEFFPTYETTKTSTPTPYLTETPTQVSIKTSPTPGPLLETPFGSQPKFIIHQVANGESLILIAKRYGTTLEAIQAVNFFLPSPLWSGWLLVIPLNTIDVENLPAFEAYVVSEEDVNADQLAINLDTDLEALLYYNAISSAEDPLPPGRWLLIPREKATP
jgi:LysM repeat protein